VLKLSEHAGWEKAHDAHHWWMFDARLTSPKTCEICKALDGTVYRGDGIAAAFPYHIHMAVNAIKALVHPHCRCRLRWVGRTEKVQVRHILTRRDDRERKRPQLPKKQRGLLSPSQHLIWWRTSHYARETFGG